MRGASYFIAYAQDRWRVARATNGEVETRELVSSGSAAGDVAALLAEWGYRAQGVCLGVPSEKVFVGRIESADLSAKGQEEVKLYRLEEQLPLDAECLTAAFFPPAGGRTLGAAVETQSVRKIVDALSASGIEVACICPTALLTLWDAVRVSADEMDFVVLARSGGLDVFRLSEGCPLAWHSAPVSAVELVRCMEVDLLDAPIEGHAVRVGFIGELDGELQNAVRDALQAEIKTPQKGDPTALAARAAAALLAGESAGWVDLRRDGLAPASAWSRVSGLVRATTLLGVVALIVLATVFYWRSVQYEKIAGGIRKKQVDEYARVFPNQPVPGDVRGRLESELKRVTGISGAGIEIPQRASALDTLRKAIANLPPAVRLRVVEMRIESGDLFIEGQAQSHTEAELISRGLKNGGFDVASPRTESVTGGGVTFRIYAKEAAPGMPVLASGVKK